MASEHVIGLPSRKEHQLTGGYEAPRISELGSVADLTRAADFGGVTDAAFPANTPFEDLGFTS